MGSHPLLLLPTILCSYSTHNDYSLPHDVAASVCGVVDRMLELCWVTSLSVLSLDLRGSLDPLPHQPHDAIPGHG
jgi:hypothetical protein